MTQEWTDAFQMLPEGEYTFTIEAIGEGVGEGNKRYREWVLVAGNDENRERLNIRLFNWQVTPLLVVLGVRETKTEGKVGFKWDSDDLIGKRFKACLLHNEYNGRKYYKLDMYKEAEGVNTGTEDTIPF